MLARCWRHKVRLQRIGRPIPTVAVENDTAAQREDIGRAIQNVRSDALTKSTHVKVNVAIRFRFAIGGFQDKWFAWLD